MEAIETTLAGLTLGEPTTFGRLTLFPLLGEDGAEPGYLTLDEALAAGTARATEVSEGGSVPEALFTNEGGRPVLLIDGEELLGAKQNRVVNLTVLVPARSQVRIPVTCVEAGRWSARSGAFSSAPRTHYARGRAARMEQVTDSMRVSGERHSDQGAVWADIEAKACRMEAHSPSGAMATIFEQHGNRIEEYVAALPAGGGQVGALFALGGEVLGLELFGHAATFGKLLPKLVRSYAADALEAEPGKASLEAARALLAAVRGAEASVHPAVGLGEDVRLVADTLAGGALLVNGQLLHLSAFARPTSSEGSDERGPGSMASARHRRAQRLQQDLSEPLPLSLLNWDD